MTLEERIELADKLREVLIQSLAQQLCTGTGKEFRERRHELARLMARVTGVVIYDGMPASEQAFGTRRLENEMKKAAENVGQCVWQAASANGVSTLK
ncbi:hypothetical protein [Pseudomonas sp. Marseille-P9899]|uniref:hypothetical protein n=1 Tax=Pseudomonas sp. Marseille-P9899 TaxID=2730401 RepID=UPI0015891DE8|nr:hypothetical protein [Pseudomonas sp. Marseille-P9899]